MELQPTPYKWPFEKYVGPGVVKKLYLEVDPMINHGDEKGERMTPKKFHQTQLWSQVKWW